MPARLLALAGLLLLTACGPRVAPAITSAPPPPGEPAPAWLPANWVADPTPPALALDAATNRVYAPRGAVAPYCFVSRLAPGEAAALARNEGRPAADWLVAQLHASLSVNGTRAGKPGPWRRAGVTGQRFEVTCDRADGERGLVEGTVAVTATPTGGVLVVGAMVPQGGDRALVERLLAAVPLEEPLGEAPN